VGNIQAGPHPLLLALPPDNGYVVLVHDCCQRPVVLQDHRDVICGLCRTSVTNAHLQLVVGTRVFRQKIRVIVLTIKISPGMRSICRLCSTMARVRWSCRRQMP
jgi:hypothetical protein